MKEIVVVNNREVHLQAYVWEPEEQKSDKALILVHSYGDSSYRYSWLAQILVKKGWTVCTFDLASHGRSGGLRAKWASLQDLLDDAEYMVRWFQFQYSANEWYGLGLGLGANLLTLIQNKSERNPTFSGLALWAPISKLSTRFPKVLLDTINYVNSFTSHLTVLTLQADLLTDDITRLYSEIPDWDEDYGRVSAKTAGILIEAGKRFMQAWNQMGIPLWVGWGKNDELVDSTWVKTIQENSVSYSTSTIKFLEKEQGYHYLEPGKTGHDITFDVLKWFEKVHSKESEEVANTVS